MDTLKRKRDYFYQIKQLIMDMLEKLQSSFELQCKQIVKFEGEKRFSESLFKRVDQAIRFIDQYYDCMQFVKVDYTPKEINFIANGYLERNEADLNQVVVSKDGNQVFSCGSESTVYIFENNDCKTIKSHKLAVYCGAFLKDGRILTAGEDKIVRIHQLVNGEYQEVAQLKGHIQNIRSIIINKDESLIATASSNIRIWDARTLTRITTLQKNSLTLSMNDEYLASGGENDICIWEILYNTEQCIFELMQTISTKNKIRSLVFSPKQKFLAASHKKNVFIYHFYLDGFNIYQTLRIHEANVNCVLFSNDLLLSGSDDCTMRLWSQSMKGYWTCYQVISTGCCINSLAINDDQNYLICDCYNRILRFRV